MSALDGCTREAAMIPMQSSLKLQIEEESCLSSGPTFDCLIPAMAAKTPRDKTVTSGNRMRTSFRIFQIRGTKSVARKKSVMM